MTKQLKAIVVGAVSPLGGPSYFSSEARNVTILAPSAPVKGWSDGAFADGGGTSHAQPQVAGAIANVLAYLPGITHVELKILISNTAIKTINAFEPTKLNGAGTLNAYKMALIAHYLSSNWPQNREQLHDLKTYDQGELAHKVLIRLDI